MAPPKVCPGCENGDPRNPLDEEQARTHRAGARGETWAQTLMFKDHSASCLKDEPQRETKQVSTVMLCTWRRWTDRMALPPILKPPLETAARPTWPPLLHTRNLCATNATVVSLGRRRYTNTWPPLPDPMTVQRRKTEFQIFLNRGRPLENSPTSSAPPPVPRNKGPTHDAKRKKKNAGRRVRVGQKSPAHPLCCHLGPTAVGGEPQNHHSCTAMR